jgi:hypothetical protein
VRELQARVRRALDRTAVREGELANWPAKPGVEAGILQWCHGAAGIVSAVDSVRALAPESEDAATIATWMRRGAELTWQAGPLRKGATLCHGTAGNGLCFLRMWSLTGEERWLERARRFAMHCLTQMQAARERVGHARFSLWTGDVGTALYLWQCIQGQSELPSWDTF